MIKKWKIKSTKFQASWFIKAWVAEGYFRVIVRFNSPDIALLTKFRIPQSEPQIELIDIWTFLQKHQTEFIRSVTEYTGEAKDGDLFPSSFDDLTLIQNA